jgi:hypothetical protein
MYVNKQFYSLQSSAPLDTAFRSWSFTGNTTRMLPLAFFMSINEEMIYPAPSCAWVWYQGLTGNSRNEWCECDLLTTISQLCSPGRLLLLAEYQAFAQHTTLVHGYETWGQRYYYMILQLLAVYRPNQHHTMSRDTPQVSDFVTKGNDMPDNFTVL